MLETRNGCLLFFFFSYLNPQATADRSFVSVFDDDSCFPANVHVHEKVRRVWASRASAAALVGLYAFKSAGSSAPDQSAKRTH